MLAKHKLKPILYSVITNVVFGLEIARKQGLHRDYGMRFVRDGLRCINLHGVCCENIAKTLFCVKSMVLFS